jgi:hypothetical protein
MDSALPFGGAKQIGMGPRKCARRTPIYLLVAVLWCGAPRKAQRPKNSGHVRSQPVSGIMSASSFSLVRIMRPLLSVLAEPSSCFPVRQHSGADLGFKHLADFGARKVIPNFNLLGCFDAPDLLLHGCADVRVGSRLRRSPTFGLSLLCPPKGDIP